MVGAIPCSIHRSLDAHRRDGCRAGLPGKTRNHDRAISRRGVGRSGGARRRPEHQRYLEATGRRGKPARRRRAPASSEQGSRLRDENVRESGCAPLNSPRAQHPSPGSHPLKGRPCSALRRRIGAEAVARAAPDGYTLLMGTTALASSPASYSRLTYDVTRDLAPVSLVVTMTNVLVVHPSLPVRSMQELLDLARARPGTLNSASAGVGSSNHLALVRFNTISAKRACPVMRQRRGMHYWHRERRRATSCSRFTARSPEACAPLRSRKFLSAPARKWLVIRPTI